MSILITVPGVLNILARKKPSIFDIQGDLTPMYVSMILANMESAKALQKELGYRKYLLWNYPKVRYLQKIVKDGEAIIRWCEERGFSAKWESEI